MNEMNTDYRGNGGSYRDYRNYSGNYRDYREDYDLRGGKENYRDYRDYREDQYKDEIVKSMYEAKECHRKMEDLAEMAKDPEEKNLLMKIAMREKEHYTNLKQIADA